MFNLISFKNNCQVLKVWTFYIRSIFKKNLKLDINCFCFIVPSLHSSTPIHVLLLLGIENIASREAFHSIPNNNCTVYSMYICTVGKFIFKHQYWHLGHGGSCILYFIRLIYLKVLFGMLGNISRKIRFKYQNVHKPPFLGQNIVWLEIGYDR